MSSRPEDFSPTARALALARSSSSTPSSPDLGRPPLIPRWSRSRQSGAHLRQRSHGNSRGLKKGWINTAQRLSRKILRYINRMPLWQRILGVILILVAITGGVLFIIYNERILDQLRPIAKNWRNLRGGWLICWFLTFVAAFPPLIGYSSTITLAGFLYGFPIGWCIVSTATVAGSFTAFIASRTVLSKYVHNLVGGDKRFKALSLTLKHDGLKLLVMVRLCPLPYSLSNGALSTIPTLNPFSFALATALATPRLLIHAFIGSRLADLATEGRKMDRKTKIINYASIVIGLSLGTLTGWLIYQRTIARAKQLEAEERAAGRMAPATPDTLTEAYSDDESYDGHGAATLLGDDEINALETDTEAYTDDFTDDERAYSGRRVDEEAAIGLNKAGRH